MSGSDDSDLFDNTSTTTAAAAITDAAEATEATAVAPAAPGDNEDTDENDVISSSSSDEDYDDSLLSSAFSSQAGATGGELTITPAELLDELLLAWSNEKLCPDLLPHRDDLIECVRDQLEGIERQLKQRGRAPKDLSGFLHKLEVSRVRYLVTDLLRSRLAKVHAYSEAMMSQPATVDANGNSRWSGRLSPAEAEFAKDFVTSQHRLYERIALAKMPQFLTRPPHPLEAPRPNLDAFVFFRVRGGGNQQQQQQQMMIVRPTREADAIELKPGEQHLMQYAPVERLLLDDKVQLI